MKNVMTRAWEIAREGQKRFGGNVKEYFAQALRLAWAEVKAPKKVEVELKGSTKRVKTWLAEIVGKHPQYVFDRDFLEPDDFDKWGDKLFYLNDGLYELYDGKRRKFIHIKNGEERLIYREEALFIAGKIA
jgi:hypothetical protein